MVVVDLCALALAGWVLFSTTPSKNKADGQVRVSRFACTPTTTNMTTHKPKADPGRPIVQTPGGIKFSDTEAYARYAEFVRIRDWLKSFLDDMEHLRIDAPTAIKRIDAFTVTLGSAHGSLKTECLDRIRVCLSGNTAMPLGRQLTALRLEIAHWDYAVMGSAHDCERPTTGQETPYTGPFPLKVDRTPAVGHARGRMTARA